MNKIIVMFCLIREHANSALWVSPYDIIYELFIMRYSFANRLKDSIKYIYIYKFNYLTRYLNTT